MNNVYERTRGTTRAFMGVVRTMWMRKPLTLISIIVVVVALLLVPVSLAQNAKPSASTVTQSGVAVGSPIASNIAVRDVTNFTPRESGDVIVKFKPGISSTSEVASAINKQVNATVVRTSEVISGMQTVKLAPGVSVDDAIAQYKSNPAVEGAWPNNKYTLDKTPTDTYYATRQWDLENTGQNILGVTGTVDADINAAGAWNSTTGSSSVIVAVADTGVLHGLTDLDGNLGAGWDFLRNTSDYSPYMWNNSGHGTHVAGTIGAVGNDSYGVAGVNWDVTIMPLQIFNWDGTSKDQNTSDDMIVDAIVWAEAHGASIINLSLGGYGTSNSLLNDTIAASSMLVVCAAGNDGVNTDSTPFYPSSYPQPNIVSVAASDNTDKLTSWSNYGATSVDLAAPGAGIFNTYFWNQSGTWYTGWAALNGTSMAAPHVAGVAALTKALHPDYGYAQLKSAILSTTDAKAAFAGKTVTGGRLNADKAVSSSAAWSSWESMSGQFTASPAAVSWADGRIDVFGRGSDNALWWRHYNNSAWSSWESLSGQLASGTGPAVSSQRTGQLDVFAIGSDNALWHRMYT